MEHRSAEGPFKILLNIPKRYGGTGSDQRAWSLCEAPLIVYALAKFGLESEPTLKAAAEYLAELVRDNGWPCVVSKELGTFRGPGRKDDPCPFATLAMLKTLAQIGSLGDSSAWRAGTEALLTLWQNRKTRHPYMFYMGTDFRKLKVPFVWYDLVHVLEVLSRFDWLVKYERFIEMLETPKAKADEQGRFTSESVWTAWKGWEFAQKKGPSRWLTLVARRIIERAETAESG